MGRMLTQKTCCACLSVGLNFSKLTKKDGNNVTFLTKFKKCISEVLWLPSFYLCNDCANLLDTVHTFRETCIKSELIRKKPAECSNTKIEAEILEDDAQNQDNIKLDFLKSDIETNEDIEHDRKESVGIDDDQINASSEERGLILENKNSSYSDNSDYENDKSDSADEKKYTRKKKCRIKEVKDDDCTTVKRKQRTRKFSCEKCQNTFPTSTKLTEHCLTEHQMDEKDIKPFSCDRCPQRFSTSSNLWQHNRYHDGIRSNMCPYCGRGFITKTDLLNHEKKHLNMREYKCEYCGKSFNTHKDIRSHKLIVHTDSSQWKYQCEICSKPFPIKSNYDSHMRRHMGDKKFGCHLCEKKFTTKCDLQRHIRSHSDVREHPCPHCGKEYKDDRVLKVHLAKAHGIGLGKIKIPVRKRSYACNFCSKAYFAKNKLIRHIYTHSGEKPFGCPICDKKFNDRSYVRQHLRNIHKIENHENLIDEKPIQTKVSYLEVSASGVK